MKPFKSLKCIFIAATAFYCAALAAAPAAWFQWRSPVDNLAICSQNAPGPGWQAVKGPFQDSQCRKPGSPKGSY